MKVNFRVWTTNLTDCQNFTLDTGPSEEDLLVSSFVYGLKEQFPHNEFKVIKIGKKRYNVVPLPQANA